MKHRLIGEVEIRKETFELEVVVHTEVIEAPEDASREELIEESLGSFTAEQEPVWEQGYPLVLPEPQEEGAAIAGEAELRSTVLIEALPYLEAAQENRYTCESLFYAAGVVETSLTEREIRATVGEVRRFLLDAGYPKP